MFFEALFINKACKSSITKTENYLEPRISVKSFAKLYSLENPVKLQEKTPEEKLQNLVAIIDAVARGEIPDKLQQSGNNIYSNKVTNHNRRRIKKRICKNRNNIKQPSLKKPEENINESIYCDVCNKTFKNCINFCLHSIKHNQDGKYSCHACEFSTISEKSIQRHVNIHEKKTLYKCEICNKGFTHNRQAIEHKNIHTGEKPFVCDLCGKAFGTSSLHTQHRRDVHWEILGLTQKTTYDCKVCDKTYLSSKGLKMHYKRHHTEDFDESELCDICGKRLGNKDSLKFHKRIHTGYKPHACDVCEKRFCKKELLTEHMRVHSGEKPFICKHCAKGFTQRSSLKIHERIHTGERPYTCHLCKKGFISKGVLDLHLNRCLGVSEDSD